MQAIVQDRYGSTDVLELRAIELPEIADDEVLVSVRAAGVDRGVPHLMTGTPYLVRLAGYGVRTPKNPVRGIDMAGVVESIGKAVTRFQRGDEVFGFAKGAFAEFASAPENKLALKPVNLSFAQAAAVPISASTALQALQGADVQRGQRVLVVGASGGVGTYAVQLAKAFGAHVAGVCSTTKVDVVRSIGADLVIDYTSEDFTKAPRRYDLILDIGGNTLLSRLRKVLKPKGTLILVGGEEGGRWTGGMDRQLRAIALSPFIGQKLKMKLPSENYEDLLVLKELIEAGKVTPTIDRTYSLIETRKAIEYVEGGHARGKVVVTI